MFQYAILIHLGLFRWNDLLPVTQKCCQLPGVLMVGLTGVDGSRIIPGAAPAGVGGLHMPPYIPLAAGQQSGT